METRTEKQTESLWDHAMKLYTCPLLHLEGKMKATKIILTLLCILAFSGCVQGLGFRNTIQETTPWGQKAGEDYFLWVEVDKGQIAEMKNSNFGFRDGLDLHFGEAHVDLQFVRIIADESLDSKANKRLLSGGSVKGRQAHIGISTNVILLRTIERENTVVRMRVIGGSKFLSEWHRLSDMTNNTLETGPFTMKIIAPHQK